METKEKLKKTENKTKEKHEHYGHRQRLKDKVRDGGLGVLKNHEVLELLLTYTVPRKDTNELAHRLLNAYGSINGVINAGYKDLIKQKGLGEESALFLSFLKEFYEMYRKNVNQDKACFLRRTQDCVEYFRDNHAIDNKEVMYIVCLNNMSKFIKEIEIKGYNDIGISFNIKDIAEHLMDKNIVNIVLFHTHPGGAVKPSDADVDATKEILQICFFFKINLCDHIILNENSHFSFGADGILYKLYESYCDQFPMNKENIKRMMQNIDFIKK